MTAVPLPSPLASILLCRRSPRPVRRSLPVWTMWRIMRREAPPKASPSPPPALRAEL